MFDRLRSKTAVATVASLVAALGVGGVAVAQNSGNTTPAQQTKSAPANTAEVPGQESNAPENSAADPDNVQAGDQSGSDKETTDGSATDKETSDGSASDSGSQQSGEQSGSEVPGNDGPGGHADEPGNANADHQATGQE